MTYTPPQDIDQATAQGFLEWVFGPYLVDDASDREGLIEVTAIPRDNRDVMGVLIPPTIQDIVDTLAHAVELNRDGYNIYYGLYLANGEPRQGRARTGEVLFPVAAVADADTAEQAKLFKASPLTPNATITTGAQVENGALTYRQQLVWLIEDPQPNTLRDIQERIAHRLGSDPVVNKPTQVMRLPGFLNHPKPSKIPGIRRYNKPETVTIDTHLEAPYPYSDLTQAFPETQSQNTQEPETEEPEAQEPIAKPPRQPPPLRAVPFARSAPAPQRSKGMNPEIQAINDAAWAAPSAWIEALQIANLKQTPYGYEGTAHWRPSHSGNPTPRRKRNLKIRTSDRTIRDHGDDKGYDPASLTASALGVPMNQALDFLSKRTGAQRSEITKTGFAKRHGATTTIAEAANTSTVIAFPLNPEPTHVEPTELRTMRDKLDGSVRLDYLIKGFLLRGYAYSMTGPSGAGKTSVAQLIMMHVAQGTPFNGMAIKNPGNVLFLAGENALDVEMRLHGMNEHYDIPEHAQDRIDVHDNYFDLEPSMPTLHAWADRREEGYSLVIVDTMTIFNTRSETDNHEVREYALLLESLTRLKGRPTVLILSHPTKGARDKFEMLPRGGVAMTNILSGNLTLVPDLESETVELHHSFKFRGPSFNPVTLTMEPVETAKVTTEDGAERIPTVVAKVVTAEDALQREDDVEFDRTILLACVAHQERATNQQRAELAANSTVMQVTTRRYLKPGGFHEKAVRDHLGALVARNLVERGDKKSVYSLTREGARFLDRYRTPNGRQRVIDRHIIAPLLDDE